MLLQSPLCGVFKVDVAQNSVFRDYRIHERGSHLLAESGRRILHDELGRSDVILSRLHSLVRLLEWASMYGLNSM